MTKTSKTGAGKTPTAKPVDIKTDSKTTVVEASPVAASPKATPAAKARPVAAATAKIPETKAQVTKAPAAKPIAKTEEKPALAAALKTEIEAPTSRPVEPIEEKTKTPVVVPEMAVAVTEKAPFEGADAIDVLNTYKEAVALYGEALDAVVTSARVLNGGYREMSQILLALATSSLEEGFKTSQALFDCKDMGEAAERQISLLQGRYENAVAGGQKLADISLTVGEKAMTPFSRPFDAAVKAWTSPLS